MSSPRSTARRFIVSSVAAALLARPATAQDRSTAAVVFPNSGSPRAQRAFIRGITLVNNFSEHAPAAFRDAERTDPAFALAYWMEAYSYRDPLGRDEQLDSSRMALARLGPTREARLAKARTPRERAWGAAIEALYADDSPVARATEFADSMRAMVRRDSSDVEALVITSFALQAIPRLRLAQQAIVHREAAALAERAFRLDPHNPGAAHAMIHVYDANRPEIARHAAMAASIYAGLAPDNAHALHMPSHIFLQLGDWTGVERTNRHVLQFERTKNMPPVGNARDIVERVDWHALNWLYFALVQEGRVREARALDDSAHAWLVSAAPGALEALGSPDARLGPGMRALQRAALTGDWRLFGRIGPQMTAAQLDSIPSRATVDWIEAAFLPGLAAAARGDSVAANAAVRRITRASALEPPATLRSTRARIWVGEIRGVLALAARDSSTSLAALADAAMADDTAAVGGPSRWWPARELLGVAQLDFGRAADAATSFRATLAHFPNRPSAELGLARALNTNNDARGARAAYASLLRTWNRADADLPEMVEARHGAVESSTPR